MTITLTDETLRYISLAESVTRARVKDCVTSDEKIIFVVEPGQLGQALGRGGEHLHRLKDLLKKRVQIVEYAEDEKEFLTNVFHNFTLKNIRIQNRGGKRVATLSVDLREKGKAIGKQGRNLKLATEVVARHSTIEQLYIQ